MSKDAAVVESGTELQHFWAPIGSRPLAPSFTQKPQNAPCQCEGKKKLRREQGGPLSLSARDPIHSHGAAIRTPQAAKGLVSKFANSRLATTYLSASEGCL